MSNHRTVSVAALLFAVALVMATAGCSSETQTASAGSLQTYTDANNLFTLEKPASWTVAVGETVQVKDTAAGGARVVFRPLFLSGAYRSLTAGAIANYLVGQDARQVSGFAVTSAREATDGSMVEIVANYTRSGVPMTGVYTVFVASPYTMFTGYEVLRRVVRPNRARVAGNRGELHPRGYIGHGRGDADRGTERPGPAARDAL